MVSPGSLECGAVLVDKPAGPTSHDVVFRLRRRLSERAGHKVKTGHSGTLDPFATGLLIVLVGRATRLQRYLAGLPKTYVADARLGWRSDSGDSDGHLTHTGRVPKDPQLPEGDLELAVPRLSAIKVGGERLYAKTRRGEDFTPPERTMTVYRAERMALTEETAVFEIDCAGGTYVRSVVGTLEDAYCEELRRTRIGTLKIEDADEDAIIDPLAVLAHLDSRDVTDEEATALIHGRHVLVGDPDGGPIALISGGRLLGVGHIRGGMLTSETILAASLEELRAR